MTDIQKATFKITLIKAVSISSTLIWCTWLVSGKFNTFNNNMSTIMDFIAEQKGKQAAQIRKDSIQDNQITTGKMIDQAQRHDIDSLGGVIKFVSLKIHPPVRFYTQRRVNGKLETYPVY